MTEEQLQQYNQAITSSPHLMEGYRAGQAGRFAEAEGHYERALSEAERENAPLLRRTLCLLGMASVLQAQMRWAESEGFTLRALALIQPPPQGNPLAYLRGVTQLALTYMGLGKYADAEALYEKAKVLAVQCLPPVHEFMGDIWGGLAQLYVRQGRFAEAEGAYQNALRNIEALHGSDDPSMAYGLMHLGGLYRQQARWPEAAAVYGRVLSIYEAKLSPEHPWLIDVWGSLASVYRHQGRLAEAERLLRRSLALAERLYPASHESVLGALSGLVQLYDAEDKFDQAEELVEKLLPAMTERIEACHPEAGRRLSNVAVHFLERDEPVLAENLLRVALDILQRSLGDNHLDLVGTVSALAVSLDLQDRAEDAEPLYRRALALAEEHLDAAHPETVLITKNYADFLHRHGQRREAAKLKTRARSATLEKPTAAGPLVAAEAAQTSTSNDDRPWSAPLRSGLEALKQRHYEAAEKPLEAAVRAAEAEPGHEAELAECLYFLANAYYGQKKYALADPPLRMALDLWCRLFGPNHPRYADALEGLAHSLQQRGALVAARTTFEQCLTLRERCLGREAPATVAVLGQLLRICTDQGELARAEALCQQLLEVRERAGGTNALEVAHTLVWLARLRQQQDTAADIAPLVARARCIYEKTKLPEDPQACHSLQLLGEIYYAWRRDREAEHYFQAALAMARAHTSPTDPGQGDLLCWLAAIAERQGNLDVAAQQYQQAVQLQEQAGPAGRTGLLKSLPLYAGFLHRRGLITEAEQAEARLRVLTAVPVDGEAGPP